MGVAQLWGQGVGAALLPAGPARSRRPVSLQHRVAALLSTWPASAAGDAGVGTECPPSELALRLWARGVLRHTSGDDRRAVHRLRELLGVAAAEGTEATSARSEFRSALALLATVDPSGRCRPSRGEWVTCVA